MFVRSLNQRQKFRSELGKFFHMRSESRIEFWSFNSVTKDIFLEQTTVQLLFESLPGSLVSLLFFRHENTISPQTSYQSDSFSYLLKIPPDLDSPIRRRQHPSKRYRRVLSISKKKISRKVHTRMRLSVLLQRFDDLRVIVRILTQESFKRNCRIRLTYPTS